MQSTQRRLSALAPIVAAAITAMAAPGSAFAQSVVFNSLLATGTYSMNGGSPVSVAPWLDTATAKDVLQFTGDGVSSVGMHSYGSTSGDFGSRSSGQGIYDVSGSFNIKLTLTNDQATAQHVNFSFYITPGYINTTALPFTGSQFTESDVSFQISASNGASFSSTAMLLSNAGGTSFTTTGENIYSGGGSAYNVVGRSYSLDLGVLNAGASVSVDYTLRSNARGDAIVGTTTTIPGYDVTVPEHWVEYTDCGYGGGYPALMAVNALMAIADGTDGVTAGGYGGSCVTRRELIAAYTYHVADQEFLDGSVGGSQASSGDPFTFDLAAGTVMLPGGQASAFNVSLSDPTNVPEPAGIALTAAALAALAAARRRRRD
jgi:hypothetical protein